MDDPHTICCRCGTHRTATWRSSSRASLPPAWTSPPPRRRCSATLTAIPASDILTLFVCIKAASWRCSVTERQLRLQTSMSKVCLFIQLPTPRLDSFQILFHTGAVCAVCKRQRGVPVPGRHIRLVQPQDGLQGEGHAPAPRLRGPSRGALLKHAGAAVADCFCCAAPRFTRTDLLKHSSVHDQRMWTMANVSVWSQHCLMLNA